MIKLFRNIRQKLVVENQSIIKNTNYIKYALGEIILVVIGILIALQVNNWNERRKSNAKFNAVLMQIYTSLDQDVEEMSINMNLFRKQAYSVDSLLNFPDKIDPTLLPSLLYYADIMPEEFTSNATQQLDLLEFDTKNIIQSRIYKSISSYILFKVDFNSYNSHPMRKVLESVDFPKPALLFSYSSINNYDYVDRTLFTEQQQKEALKLVQEQPFKNALKSALSQERLAYQMVYNQREAALELMNVIKQYYPKVKLLYQNIGIIGDASPNQNWTDNEPMTLIDESSSIWELKVRLNDGGLKFRDGNSWVANWGGDTFPDDSAIWFGSNIPVKKGYYKITLNLTEKKYQFELIKE